MIGLLRRARPGAAPLLGDDELAALIATAERWPAATVLRGLAAEPGEGLSHRRGRGSEFQELRPYQPGDDLRDMDWRATARSGRPWVRQFHEERQVRLHLVLDRGPSMRFATRGRLKVTQGLRLAALWGAQAAASGACVGGSLVDADHALCPCATGQRGLLAWLAAANRPCPPQTGGSAVGDHLAWLAANLPAGTQLLLISDFAGLDETQQALLGALSARHEVHAVQVLDPVERELPDVGDAPFLDLAGRYLQLPTGDPELRSRYRATRAAREESLAALFAQARIPLRRFLTTDDVEAVLTRG